MSMLRPTLVKLVCCGVMLFARAALTNTGTREGADVPQVYLKAAPDEQRQRLLGFKRVALEPGESAKVLLDVDPRLLGHFDAIAGKWRIVAGTHKLVLGHNAEDISAVVDLGLTAHLFGK